jgi:hypothetical protein
MKRSSSGDGWNARVLEEAIMTWLERVYAVVSAQQLFECALRVGPVP